MQGPHEIQTPSTWVARWARLVRSGGAVLDVACGRGRHARYFARLGCQVVAVDRDEAAVGDLAGVPAVEARTADLEQGPWPFAAGAFDAVVVVNYLHRPLFGHLIDALAPDGVLIYETFMAGNERFGRPSNPDFLLRPNELLEVVQSGLAVVAFEQGCLGAPRPAVVQRLCARRGAAATTMLE